MTLNNYIEPSPPPVGDVSVLAVYSDDSLDSIIVTFPAVVSFNLVAFTGSVYVTNTFHAHADSC